MKSYEESKVSMKIINLDGSIFYDSDITNCMRYVKSGQLVILQSYLQHAGLFSELTGLIYRDINSLFGDQKSHGVEKDGLNKIHNYLNVGEISDLYKKIRGSLKDKMPAVTASMFRSLGLTSEFYVHESSLIRIMLPFNEQKKYQRDYELGKLTLHGPHHDFFQNVPINAINTWAALGSVEKENSMFIYPDCWQKRIPQGDNGTAKMDQYLGVPLEFSMNEGDVLIFHSNHMHASRLNTTGNTRIVLTNRVTEDWPKYLFAEQPQIYFSSTGFDTITDFAGMFDAPGFLGKKKYISSRWLIIYYKIMRKLTGRSALRSDRPQLNDLSSHLKEIESKDVQSLKNDEVIAIDKKTCVARIDGNLISFSRYCTHQGADLALGYIDENKIVCPYHGAKFDLTTGRSPCEGLNNIRVNNIIEDTF